MLLIFATAADIQSRPLVESCLFPVWSIHIIHLNWSFKPFRPLQWPNNPTFAASSPVLMRVTQ